MKNHHPNVGLTKVGRYCQPLPFLAQSKPMKEKIDAEIN
jgi:hypothetical protein